MLVRELKRLGRRVTLIRRRKARAKKWAKGIDLRDEHTKAGVTKCHVATRWATSFTTESSECTELSSKPKERRKLLRRLHNMNLNSPYATSWSDLS